MTNLGPLTTTFTPSGAKCQSTFAGANNDNGWIQYGNPTSTTACVPTSFEPFEGYYYSPGVCPSGYTYACSAGVGSGSTQATCCPRCVNADSSASEEKKKNPAGICNPKILYLLGADRTPSAAATSVEQT